MRTVDFNATPKAAVVSNTVTFSQSDIGAAAGIVRLFGVIAGSGNGRYLGAGGIEGVVIKANGSPICIWNHKNLAAYNSRLSLANVNPYYGEDLAVATTTGLGDFFSRNQQFTIPLHFADLEDEERADQCQFPPGSTISVEFICGATITTSATIALGWMTTEAPAKCYPNILSQFLNFGASGNNQSFALAQPGIFRGIVLPRLGLARLRIVIAGRQIFHAKGFNATTSTNPTIQDEGDMISESQQFENAPQPFSTVEGTNDLAIYNLKNHICIMNDTGLALTLGGSKIEIDTGSAWATATPDNTACVVSYIPIGQ